MAGSRTTYNDTHLYMPNAHRVEKMITLAPASYCSLTLR